MDEEEILIVEQEPEPDVDITDLSTKEDNSVVVTVINEDDDPPNECGHHEQILAELGDLKEQLAGLTALQVIDIEADKEVHEDALEDEPEAEEPDEGGADVIEVEETRPKEEPDEDPRPSSRGRRWGHR